MVVQLYFLIRLASSASRFVCTHATVIRDGAAESTQKFGRRRLQSTNRRAAASEQWQAISRPELATSSNSRGGFSKKDWACVSLNIEQARLLEHGQKYRAKLAHNFFNKYKTSLLSTLL
jgi:hypothetical protein